MSKIKNNYISKLAIAKLKTMAIRVPSNKTIRNLLMKLEFPLAAPSANMYGKISPTNAIDVLEELKNKIPFIIDGGASKVGIESTIIDLSTNNTNILRHGSISKEKIERF